MNVDLSRFNNSWYSPGRGVLVRSVWFLVNSLFLRNPLNPFSELKVILLRAFGAKIGAGVVLKPGLNIKYPWHVEISDHSWIGENVWLDSIAPISIGRNACLSQGSYVGTGNHDWGDPAFGLVADKVVIENGAWVGAWAVIGPGVRVGAHSVVTMGAVVTKDTEAFGIYSGNPATFVRHRKIRPE